VINPKKLVIVSYFYAKKIENASIFILYIV